MSETTLQWITGLKLLFIGAFAMLYGFGGISGKWKRRIIGSIVYTIGICGFSLWIGTFNWWLLSLALSYYAMLSIGYGGDEIGEKILKRSRYGFCCSLAALPVFILTQAWGLLGLHILLCTLTSMVAGVWNETSSARAEETLIGTVLVLVPIFLI